MDKVKTIPIVFAADDKYVKQLSTVIVSILLNSKKENKFEFNILTSNISDENQKLIEKLSEYNPNTEFNFIDMKDYLKNFDLEKYMSRREDYTYISIETYYRFFIPEIFNQYEKVLYLDADAIVLDDIQELFDTKIDDFYAGVVEDPIIKVFFEEKTLKTRTYPDYNFEQYYKEKLKKKNNKYFNAGVILFNLKKVREDNVVAKLWDFVQNESPLEYQDQDVLNSVLENNVKFLDYKWNVLKDINIFGLRITDKKERNTLLKTYKRPGFFHYVGSNKPWIVLNQEYGYFFVFEWWKYYQKTPFFNKEDEKILKAVLKRKKQYKRIIFANIRAFGKTMIYIGKEKNLLRLNLFGVKTRIKLFKENTNMVGLGV